MPLDPLSAGISAGLKSELPRGRRQQLDGGADRGRVQVGIPLHHAGRPQAARVLHDVGTHTTGALTIRNGGQPVPQLPNDPIGDYSITSAPKAGMTCTQTGRTIDCQPK
jgi:hypothetical protein